MIWLGIDTSNYPLSVAIVQDGKILAEETTNVKLNHSIATMPTVEEVFRKAGLKPNEIDAIAVSEGPGSYTGVRIGVTIAKTLAWSLKKPIVGVSSIKVLAANAPFFHGLICPIMDARRSNVYSGVYEWSANNELQIKLEDGHYSINDLLQKLTEVDAPVLFVGSDVELHAEKIREVLGDRAVRAPYTLSLPRASVLIHLAEQDSAEDVHHFVPQYRRLAEAEANWIKEQKKAGQADE